MKKSVIIFIFCLLLIPIFVKATDVSCDEYTQDESAINKARQKLVKKFIAAAAVFLIFTLVQFIVSTLANDSRTTMTCVDYLLNGYVA